jgi:hypothetical protein
MAYRVATADGNLTTAGTWGAVDATSLLDSQAGNSVLSTTPTGAAAGVTPGAITIDAIAVKIASRAASPAGTMTIVLRNVTDGADVAGTSVTINVSDIPDEVGTPSNTFSGCSIGWFLFKLAAPVLLVAGKAYNVRASTSSSNMVNLFRDATASNWSRMLRTTTTGAPAAGDSMFVLGEWTAAATKTDRVVTMDSLIGTDYGGGSLVLASLGVGKGGTFQYGSTAATNYAFRISGVIQVWLEGIFTIGTVATPIPRDSTAALELDSGTDGDFGIVSYGTFTVQGLSRTSGKNITYCKLNTDEAAGQTVLGVDTDTGWLNGDEIAITTTTQTRDQGETATLSGGAAASSITITAGLAAAHGGNATTKVQAEVILLTRNVRITGVTAGVTGYIALMAGAVDVDWCLFRYIAGAQGALKGGVSFNSTTFSSFGWDFNVHRDSAAAVAFDILVAATVTLTHTHFWSGWTTGAVYIDSGATGATLVGTDMCIVNDATGSGAAIQQQAAGTLTLTRVHISGSGGAALSIGSIDSLVVAVDLNMHGNGSGSNSALTSTGRQRLVWTRPVLWRNSAYALRFTNVSDIDITDGTIFANANGGLSIENPCQSVIRNTTFAGDGSFASTAGATISSAAQVWRGKFIGCTFSSGTAHTTADIAGTLTAASTFLDLTFVNTVLGAATEIAASVLAGAFADSAIRYQRKDGTTNTHETVYPRLGTVAYETSTFRTAAPSERLTPSGATSTFKLRSAVKRAPIAATKVLTVTVHVRKDAGYTGSAPRLIARANPALGYDSDTVLDTLSVGSGVWEQLTGTTTPVAEETGVMEFYVDCDGSAGNVYVDDWSAQQG